MPRILPSAALLFLLASFPASASSGRQAGIGSTVSAAELTPRQIHAYASALLEIQKMRQMVSARAAKLQSDQAALLKRQAQAEMIGIVGKHGLDLATFNAITARIEQHRKLRHQVRQLMMEQLLST
ncbi:DUF4168 domain-containing protein [Sphingobium sp. CFD-2]|uniref:DUF4168 domain-containing protein n=1 Tax=Sphingobium sp. CFD-2 TaxID=2878542 RepID=UPI00214B2096|nr:DUF4168 domain-containing protein [Sphingobium sp. CFD-2]